MTQHTTLASRLAATQTPDEQALQRHVDALLDELEAARALEKQWQDADPRGTPSEIVLRERELAAAREHRQRLEAQVHRLRGDDANAGAVPHPGTQGQAAAPVTQVAGTTIQRSTKDRREDMLTPVVRRAQDECKNPHDVNEVWPVLVRMADDEVPPLLASTPEGVKYQKDGCTEIFSRRALRERLRRQR